MGKIEEAKKILETYGNQIREIIETPDITIPMVVAKALRARDKTAKEICQLFEPKPDDAEKFFKAECQERVKRILEEIDKHFSPEYRELKWWQVLKKRERIG